jgi:hypothetical protein
VPIEEEEEEFSGTTPFRIFFLELSARIFEIFLTLSHQATIF